MQRLLMQGLPTRMWRLWWQAIVMENQHQVVSHRERGGGGEGER